MWTDDGRTDRRVNTIAQSEHFVLRWAKNAGYQHFLLFPWIFQKASCTGSLKVVIEWSIVNPLPHNNAFCWLKRYIAVKKHCDKRRNCLKQAISPFLTTFSTLYGTYFPFLMLFKMPSAIPFNFFNFSLEFCLPNRKSLQKTISNLMKVAEMGRKHCWKKGEIACYEQFLLFPQCFLQHCTADM